MRTRGHAPFRACRKRIESRARRISHLNDVLFELARQDLFAQSVIFNLAYDVVGPPVAYNAKKKIGTNLRELKVVFEKRPSR